MIELTVWVFFSSFGHMPLTVSVEASTEEQARDIVFRRLMFLLSTDVSGELEDLRQKNREVVEHLETRDNDR